MSQVISSNTVRNVLTVTKRTPASISRRASRQHWPKRFMPYRSRTAVGSFDRSKASRACGLVIRRNAASKLLSSNLRVVAGGELVDRLVDDRAQLAPPVEPGLADLGRRQQVGHFEIRLRRIGHQRERVVGLAQEAGVLAVRQVAAGGAHRLGQDDVGRQVGLAAAQIGQRAAGVRRVDAAGEQPAGLHHLVPGVVHGGGRVIAAADQRKLVGVLGGMRKDFGDLDARGLGLDRLERPANLGRGVGLHVQQSSWLGAPRLKIMITPLVVVVGHGALGLGGQQLGQRQADGRQRADLQEIAARDAVAGMRLSPTAEIQHRERASWPAGSRRDHRRGAVPELADTRKRHCIQVRVACRRQPPGQLSPTACETITPTA